jgi:hypothetical protein
VQREVRQHEFHAPFLLLMLHFQPPYLLHFAPFQVRQKLGESSVLAKYR